MTRQVQPGDVFDGGEDVQVALSLVSRGRIYDLAHPLRRTTSHYPTHVGFRLELVRRHGDRVRKDGSSSASCMFSMGTHTGTHLDALGHISQDGLLFDGTDARANSEAEGLRAGGIDLTPPLVCRGVLLDLTTEGGRLEAGREVTVRMLHDTMERQGIVNLTNTAVFLRTGWEELWETERYVDPASPGPGIAAAKWLADQGVRLTGSDTAVFERGPVTDAAPVHTELLVKRRIQIIESMHLNTLAAEAVYQFTLICVPLRLEGATGSPVRPLAVT